MLINFKKDSSQETIISLAGLLCGSLVVSQISSQWATWTALITLLAIHLATNYLAVRAVRMRTLNRQRANLVFSTYLANRDIVGKEHSTKSFLVPEDVSIQERVFERDGVVRWQGGKVLGCCEIGVPLSRILNLFSKPNSVTGSHSGPGLSDAARLLNEFEEDDYILWHDQALRTSLVVLKSSSNVAIQLHAWMHALLLAKQIDEGLNKGTILEAVIQTHAEVKALISKTFDAQLVEAGWDIETGALETRSGTRIKKDESGRPPTRPFTLPSYRFDEWRISGNLHI